MNTHLLINQNQNKVCLFESENGREINYYHLKDTVFSSNANQYPNVGIKSGELVYNPIQEKIMSLSSLKMDRTYEFNTKHTKIEKNPVFFLIYNFDNYFHFLYDTLPYLITYQKIKFTIPNLKLLVQMPPMRDSFYPFVYEFLNILNIKNTDLVWAKSDTVYADMYISDSYTHGIDSELTPRKEVYFLYDFLKEQVKDNKSYPENVYISRRTWLHNDCSNIGTDYTSRRVMINENELVSYLQTKGYVEVFSEKMSTIEKINLFSNAKNIVGAIGGGIANAVFSKNANLYALISPTFMDKHQRFQHVFTNTNVTYFNHAEHVDTGEWKRYMRVKVVDKNIVGEVEEILSDGIVVSYVDTVVAGWNRQLKTKKDKFAFEECIRLDDGLNSPWKIDIDKLKQIL